ncbi:DinB family protein [Pseudobacteroides cellulosolvens]|uniref:DinB-like domain containing protein n=1 Tax=Pseudobacteroides cellulosolvens ATCC 35603 = DSM 2933 TaxID=398512 RepID=A0A0L6JJ03_9FIRM|nr:DinB family protein [Pseudobacteroides cellulosolvens]KNY25846.1 DinB-like domain containing protein [Pseudobacteroides cellulosolvens ATCC 35603 = DSM 2933]
MSITSEWNLKQKRLTETIRNPSLFAEAKRLLVDMHSSVHFAEMSGQKEATLIDQLWDGMQNYDFAIMPSEKAVTIAWNIWHITRIEDLTINILVNETNQVLSDEWLSRLHIHVTDTGNAMSDDEIMDFSKRIDIEALKDYRIAVGLQTQKILSKLKSEDMKRKIKSEGLTKIFNEGGILEHPDSIWLLDFWGKKDVAGIILMPITRHQIVHINDGFKIKQSILKKKKYFRT